MDLTLLHKTVLIAAGAVMILAALNDAARFKIPNLASLVLFILFPLFIWTHEPSLPWTEHLLTFGFVLVGGYALYAKGWAGAGDIKFISAIALWAGPHQILPFLLITTLAGGMLSLGIGGLTLIKQKLSKKPSSNALSQTPIPYGVAIAVGGLCTLVLLSSPDLSSLS